MTEVERSALTADLGHPTGLPAPSRAQAGPGGPGGFVVDPVLDGPDDDGGEVPDWMRELIP